ncbi:MAG: hypothetical protein AAGM22_21065 [Acidobacteriota bacterium]
MSDADREIEQALREMAGDSPADEVSIRHPEVDEILRLRQGLLDRAAEEEILDHLSRCRECSTLALAAPDFVEAEREWMESAALESTLSTANSRVGGSGRRLWAIAATLVAGLGLGFLAAELLRPSRGAFPQSVDESAVPQSPEVFLQPLTSGTLRSASLVAPPPGGIVIFLLDPPSALASGAGAALERRENSTYVSVDRGEPELNPLGTYSFQVEAGLLRPGSYRIRIVEETEVPVGPAFEFEVRGRP